MQQSECSGHLAKNRQPAPPSLKASNLSSDLLDRADHSQPHTLPERVRGLSLMSAGFSPTA